MIKPEFWDDEKLSAVSRDARLVYIGLWNFSDDYGVVKGSASWILTRLFPYELSLLDDIKSWLQELENIKRLLPFQNANEKYYFMPKFLEHQKINRPSQQRNPEPPDDILKDSRHTHGALTPEGKGKGKEIKGKERNKNPLFFEISNHYQKEMDDLTKKLQKNFPNIIHFRNEKLNIGVNPKTIIHAFKQAIKKQTFDDVRGGIESYIAKIIIIEDGNYNEKEHIQGHDKKKSDTQITTGIKGVVGGIGVRI